DRVFELVPNLERRGVIRLGVCNVEAKDGRVERFASSALEHLSNLAGMDMTIFPRFHREFMLFRQKLADRSLRIEWNRNDRDKRPNAVLKVRVQNAIRKGLSQHSRRCPKVGQGDATPGSTNDRCNGRDAKL